MKKSLIQLFMSLTLCLTVQGFIFAQPYMTNIDASGMKISSRVTVPDSFFRPPFPVISYQAYLQSLDLKSLDALVMKYDGYEKSFKCYAAVLSTEFETEDMKHGEHSIQFLRAKYLFDGGKYDLIDFSYDDNRSLSFAQWGVGARFVYQDTSATYILDTIASENYSVSSFRKYLGEIAKNSTTCGLKSDTKLIGLSDLSVGDLFIQPQDKHSPGHAVLVIDMVVNPYNNEKLVLLAQGYSPTQDVHVLHNPYEEDISPWYRVKEDEMYFATAQWTFRKKHVRRFSINANAFDITNAYEDLLAEDEDEE